MLFTLFCNTFINLFENTNQSFLKGAGKKNADTQENYAGKCIERKTEMVKEKEK